MAATKVAGTRRAREARTKLPPLPFLLGVPAAVVALLFFVPLVGLVIASVRVNGDISGAHYLRSFNPSQDPFLPIVGRTAVVAAVVTLVCGILGYAVAYTANSLPGKWGPILLGMICLPYFTSALIRTYSLQVILSSNGPVNDALIRLRVINEPVQLVYNDVGVIIGMTQVLLPMMVFPLYSTMRTIDPLLLRAAVMLGSSRFRAWRTVFVPLSTSGLSAGSALVFVVSLGFYTTPMLLQGASSPVFAQRIDSLSAIPDAGGLVAAQSTVVLFGSLCLLAIFRKPLGIGSANGRSTRKRFHRSTSTPGHWAPVSAAAERWADSLGGLFAVPIAVLLTATAALLSLGPIVVIAILGFSGDSFLGFPPKSFSLRWYHEVFADPAWTRAMELSFRVSAITAAFALLAGAGAAFLIARSRRRKFAAVGFAVLVIPLVVPQVIIAIAMYSFLRKFQLTGTSVALVFGYLIVTVPIAVILLTSAFRELDQVYERASSSLGASPSQTARWVIFPLIVPSLLATLLFSFVTAFSDLVLAQFLGGPRAQTLERLVYQDIRESVSPEVAAVGTLLMGVVLVLVAISLAAQALPSHSRRNGKLLI